MQIKHEIKNILCVRNDRFGEFLLNIPALRALKETFPAAKITMVVDPYVAELAQAVPFISEIIEWPNVKHDILEKFKFIKLLKSRSIDMAVMLNSSKELNIITHFAGIPIRVGYDRKFSFLLTHKIKDLKHLGEKHEVDYNLELAGLVGAATKDKAITLNIDNDIASNLFAGYSIKADDFLVALHPWTSDHLKQWPQARFSELINKLSAVDNLKIIIVGSTKFKYPQNNKILNLTSKTNLQQLAGVLKKCKVLISCDSGPMHLAACVGTPVVALFRNDIQGKTAKRWGPWGQGHMVIEKNSLLDITVDEVYAKVMEVVNK